MRRAVKAQPQFAMTLFHAPVPFDLLLGASLAIGAPDRRSVFHSSDTDARCNALLIILDVHLRRYLFSVILCSLIFSTRQTEEEASRLTVRSRVHAKAVLAVPLPLIRYVLAIIRLARIAGFSNRRRTVSRAIDTESLFDVSEPYPSICCARFLITVHA